MDTNGTIGLTQKGSVGVSLDQYEYPDTIQHKIQLIIIILSMVTIITEQDYKKVFGNHDSGIG